MNKSMNPQDSQSELTRKQRLDNINVSFLADDVAYLVHGTSWKNLTSEQQNRLLFGTVDLAMKIDDYVTTQVKEVSKYQTYIYKQDRPIFDRETWG